ncbi:MAG TPA: hypothetical protein VJM51_06060 [Dehalococcoidia bacterium]|nr:hypothetical protein [Dehalococcoidia bacterium]
MPGHDALRAHLVRQRVMLRSGRWIEELGADLSESFKRNAPVASGRLVNVVSKLTAVRETAQGLEIGMGDKTLVGRDTSAPRGTIKAFLRDHATEIRQYRAEYMRQWRRDNPKGRYKWSGYARMRGLHSASKGPSLEGSKAWWSLPRPAKKLLQQLREGGQYGGETAAGVGKAPYFYVQEAGLPAWKRSADEAAIPDRVHYFMERTLYAWRQMKRQTVRRFVEAMKRA